MIDAIKSLIFGNTPENARPSAHSIELASAALLFEVMTIDQHCADEEIATIRQLLSSNFSLSADELQELLSAAQQETEQATSLYQFTSVVNNHFSPQEKQQLMINLWRVALADGDMDKHEEALIRRISELIHLRHSEFIQAKHQARAN